MARNMESQPFYRAEQQAYGGAWNCNITVEEFCRIVDLLCHKVGEKSPLVHVDIALPFHEANADYIGLAVDNVMTPQLACHELAHVLEHRWGGEPADWHSLTTWNLVALLCAIAEDVL